MSGTETEREREREREREIVLKSDARRLAETKTDR